MNPFTHAPRGSMHPARIARIFAANDGRCHVCRRKLRPGDDYEIDHVLALAKGGTDDDGNLAPCCSGCHAIKTGGDISDAAKSKRIYEKSHVPKRFRQSRGWRR